MLMIVVRCAIWYHLYNLKNVKNTYGGVLLLVKLVADLLKVTLLHGCFSRFLKSDSHPPKFFFCFLQCWPFKNDEKSFFRVATHFYQTNSRSFPEVFDNFPGVFRRHIMHKLRYGNLKLTFFKK